MMQMNHSMRVVIVLLSVTSSALAFAPYRSYHAVASSSSTQLHGLLGRFRNKRTVEQVVTIQPGSKLPAIDVERLIPSKDGDTFTSQAASIQDVLGNSKALLIGMPGAFTTTCTTEHLPGYIANANQFKSLGIAKIAVVTTNDRFVNEKWETQLGLHDHPMITILSDGDGDLVKNLGLADDMGFGIGTRSKRFVMVVDKGSVTDLLMDEGMEDCTTTSAANLLQVLTPEPSTVVDDGTEVNGGAVLGVAAVLVALLASQVMGGSSSSAPAPTPAPMSRPAPQRSAPQRSAPQSDGQFKLLNQYMKND